MLRYAVLLLLLSPVLQLRAEHHLAATISVRCIGGEIPNMHEVTLVLTLDCAGQQPIPQTLNFRNDCGISFQLTGLLPDSVYDVSPLCPAQLPNSTCNEGGTLTGAKAYIYRQEVFLSPCSRWTVAWDLCCRSTTVNLVGTPGIYVEATVDNVLEACNALPVFTDRAIPFVCLNTPVTYNPGVWDAEGDSLRFRLVDALFANPNPFPVNYVVPYYGGQPFTGMAIDAATGTITFTPTLQGNIVVAVLVEEYIGGQLHGTVTRDFMFTARTCTNAAPTASAGTVENVTGAGAGFAPYGVKSCSQGQTCFSASFSDPDAGQQVSLTSNVVNVLHGATFTTTPGAPATATICFEAADQTPGVHHFTIVAWDDACPIRASRAYTYTVRVGDAPPPYAGDDASISVCPQADPFTLLDSLGGTPPTGGTWNSPSGAHGNAFTPPSDPAGAYVYTVVDADNCPGSATLSVAYLPGDLPECIALAVTERVAARPQVFPNPAAEAFTITGLGTGTPVITLVLIDALGRTAWTTSERPSNGTLTVAPPASLAKGDYVLRLTDGSGTVRFARVAWR